MNEIIAVKKRKIRLNTGPSEDMLGHTLQSTQKDCPQSMDEWCAEEENDS